MEMDKLLKFIEEEDTRLNQYYGERVDKDRRVLARAVKLSEEMGELCNDVLAHASLQRNEKLNVHRSENIQEEFADVIITALLLARAMGVDVLKGIESKIGKIEMRYK